MIFGPIYFSILTDETAAEAEPRNSLTTAAEEERHERERAVTVQV